MSRGRGTTRSCWRSRAPSRIEPEELDDIIDEQNLERQLFTDPLVVTELLQRYYREQGYLAAEIDAPRYEFAGHRRRASS